MDCATLASLHGFREPSTYESIIAQCSPSGCTPCLGKRAQRFASVEDWKQVAGSDESRFRLLNTDGRLRIWRQAHEAMEPTCQVGTAQGHGSSIMVWGAFS
ncbi:transposable element Tcb2 transposase [Trichonephila clavipes]|uniref:Transposable element Tcb2 transposase n=1 Tax=Trichonephila clavipes TaxID=2585209 RepID=A0A8X6SNE4_TRICX|nr:transposable element Tcb2 transposase [Trichonephila clavipes]